MSYSDERYSARHEIDMVGQGTVTIADATMSADAAEGTYTNYLQRKLLRRTKVLNARAYVFAAGDNSTAAEPILVALMNGTTTIGSAAISTYTAGESVDFTITAANADIAADGQIDVDLVGTATGSADHSMGDYQVTLEANELFG